MKKSAVITLSVVGVVVVAALVTPVIDGMLIQKNFKTKLLAATHNKALLHGVKTDITLVSFKRNWFSSSAVIDVNAVDGHNLTHVIKPIDLRISNYPLSYVNSSLHFGTTLRGKLDTVDNKYHAKFSLVAGENILKAGRVVVDPMTLTVDKNTKLTLSNIFVNIADYHHDSGKFVISMMNPELFDTGGDKLHIENIKLNINAQRLLQKSGKVDVGLEVNRASVIAKENAKDPLKHLAVLANLHYSSTFTNKQFMKLRDQSMKYLMMRMMLGENPDKKSSDVAKLEKVKQALNLTAVRFVASKYTTFKVSGLKFNDSHFAVNLRNFALSFPNLPENATFTDYLVALRYQIDLVAPKLNFGVGAVNNVSLKGGQGALLQSKTDLQVGNIDTPSFKLQKASVTQQASSHGSGLANANLITMIKSINTPVGVFKDINFAVSMGNLDKKEYIKFKNLSDGPIWALMVGGSYAIPKYDIITRQLRALITNKFNYAMNFSAQLPLGKASAHAMIDWPTLAKGTNPSVAAIKQATSVKTNFVIPQGYINMLLKSELGNKSQAAIDMALAKNNGPIALANMISTWKQQGLIHLADDHYAMSFQVDFKDGLAVTVNHQKLNSLQMGYLLYNLNLNPMAEQVLLPLAKKHNARAEYILALVGMANQKQAQASKYLAAAIANGSVEAKQLKRLIITTSVPVGPVQK